MPAEEHAPPILFHPAPSVNLIVTSHLGLLPCLATLPGSVLGSLLSSAP